MNGTNQKQPNGDCPTRIAGFDGVSTGPDEERSFIPKSGRWLAKWIWLNRSAYPDRQTCRATLFCENDSPFTIALFRREFDIPFIPARGSAWISADTKYRCWINGIPVARGPAEVGGDYDNREPPDWWFYDGIELDNCLHEGRNTIAVEVMLGPQVQADYSMGRGGLLFELGIDGKRGERLGLHTDDTWRAALSRAETQQDVFDAREEFRGWKDAGFDDSAWPRTNLAGTVEQAPWNLLPREIPMLAETRIPPVAVEFEGKPPERPALPLTLEPGEPRTFRLRFPREVSGFVFLDMKGPEGARVDLDFREMPGAAGSRESLFLPAHRLLFSSRRLQGFEFLQVTVTFPDGVRRGEPLTIRAMDAVFTSFPVEYRGRFKCSDPFLNQLWDVGRWTNQLCMQAYHMDSPIHQEGLGCTGDYMIEALISYCCFGEARLARKDILRTAFLLKQKRSRMFHTSYSLLWVWMLWDYWMYSGDDDSAAGVLGQMHDLLDLFHSYVGKTGLVTKAPNYMFMDWAAVGAFNLHHPPGSMGHGCMSAFYFRALLYAAELSRHCGNAERAALYDRRAAGIEHAFNEHLWNAERGLYCDGIPGATGTAPNRWLPADPGAVSYSAHTNALAVAVGIAPAASRQAIMRSVLGNDSLPLVQPYFMHYVFEALHNAGLFEEYAFDLMKRWKVLLEEHPSSLKEMWHGGDYSHAWGGSPACQLSTRVLGISCRAKGFRAFALSPHPGPLNSAEGIVPTPNGLIRIAWRRNKDSLSVRLSGPSGLHASLPATDARVLQDGKRPCGLNAGENGLSWTLNGGEYAIEIITKPGTGAAAESGH